MKINGHSHILPNPEEIPAFMKEKKIFWIDTDRKFMRQGEWKRPITDPSFFLTEKLEWMEQNHIDMSVVLNLSQLYGNGLNIHDLKDALTFQNDYNASLQHNHPNKFITGFVVHGKALKWSLKEIERCVEQHKMKLLCLPTHFLDQNNSWKGIFSKEMEPIFELANRYKLAVEIHPYDGEKFIALENQAWRFHLVWMLAQCADAYHFYTLHRYYQKYENLRVCFAHGGQLNHMNIGRRATGFSGRPDLFEGMTHPELATGHKNIYFDTLVHDVLSFELMVKRLGGTDQIIMGLDDPYPLGEMDNPETGSTPGGLIQEAVDNGIITQQQSDQIWEHNVLKWLGIQTDLRPKY